jgi:hypothetical protein
MLYIPFSDVTPCELLAGKGIENGHMRESTRLVISRFWSSGHLLIVFGDFWFRNAGSLH